MIRGGSTKIAKVTFTNMYTIPEIPEKNIVTKNVMGVIYGRY